MALKILLTWGQVVGGNVAPEVYCSSSLAHTNVRQRLANGIDKI